MRLATTSAPPRSGTGHPSGRAPARRRAAIAALTVAALGLAACGGSARSSMRPLVDEEPDAASAMVETPTTARPPSVTAKIDTSSTSSPPRQSRTDPGGSSGTGGDVGAGGSEEGVGDLATPESSVPAGSGGTSGEGAPATSEPTTTTVPTTTSTTFPPGTVVIKVRATTNLGVILVDGENHTLYASIADVNNEGTCHGECTAQWVPIAGDRVATGEGVVPGLIGAVTRPDTIVQLTYGGHPLYRLNNEPIGEVMGQADAATWYVLDAASGAFVVT